MHTSFGLLILSFIALVKDYDFVGAGDAREIQATIVAVIPHRSRAWPAPTIINLASFAGMARSYNH